MSFKNFSNANPFFPTSFIQIPLIPSHPSSYQSPLNMKYKQSLQNMKQRQDHDPDHEDLLRLSLSTGSSLFDQETSQSPANSTTSSYPTPPSPSPSPSPIPHQDSLIPYQDSDTNTGSSNHSDSNTLMGRPHAERAPRRRSPKQILSPGKPATVPAPYPWTTTRRATLHNLQYLQTKGLNAIRGRVQCKRCERQFDMEYNLHEKFTEVAVFIAKNKDYMHQRAPPVWMNPTLPDCRFCEQNNCVKPILSKKRSINWLFLLLGQMIGCCKLSELKYFCKHTRIHRTGAKDRVLYSAYLELCRQLDPDGSYVG